MEAVAEIETQLYCHSKSGKPSTGKRRGRSRPQPWFLNIIIFGVEGLEDKVGVYLSKRKMYLQDPRSCERVVPYRNPHIIQPESGDTMMTKLVDPELWDLEVERLQVGPDLLAQLMEDEVPLLEAEAPDIVTTNLFR